MLGEFSLVVDVDADVCVICFTTLQSWFTALLKKRRDVPHIALALWSRNQLVAELLSVFSVCNVCVAGTVLP